MNMKNNIIKTLSTLLFFTVICGCGKDGFDKPDYYTTVASSEFAQAIVEGSENYITHVKTDSETELMDGVTLLDLGFLNRNSHAMRMFVYKIELAPAMVKVSVPGDAVAISSVQKMTEQAMSIENKGTYLVMGGISGSAFNAETGAPKGMLYHNGKALNSEFGKDGAFFSIMKDGEAICLEASEFSKRKDKVTEGISGTEMILKNGYVLSGVDESAAARTAVGVDENGSTVYLVAVDGVDFYYSNGITAKDLAYVLKGCGAFNAMTLNTGNEVTAFVRNEDSLDLFEVVNKPGNMGIEAAVGNGLVILQY